MMSIVVLFALAFQEPPRPGQPPRPVEPQEGIERRTREQAQQEELRNLERQIAEVREQLKGMPADAPSRVEKQRQLDGLLEKLRALAPRAVQPPNPPQPPRPGERPQRPPIVRPIENVEVLRAWLRENEPETYTRLMKAQDDGLRPEVMQLLSEAEHRMRQMNEMKERDPKGFERMKEMRRLEGESLVLGDRARQAAPDERERVSKELSQVLQKLFDLREENRAREVAELKRRVDALEKELSNRKANKDRIVERRRRELLGEKSEEDW